MTPAIVALAILVVFGLLLVLLRTRAGVRELDRQVESLRAVLATLPAAAEPAGTAQAEVVSPPVPVITDLSGAGSVADDRATAAKVVSLTLADPLIKALALAAGLRRALDGEHRMHISYAFRRELKRQRRLRRRAAAARSRRTAGWLP